MDGLAPCKHVDASEVVRIHRVRRLAAVNPSQAIEIGKAWRTRDSRHEENVTDRGRSGGRPQGLRMQEGMVGAGVIAAVLSCVSRPVNCKAAVSQLRCLRDDNVSRLPSDSDDMNDFGGGKGARDATATLRSEVWQDFEAKVSPGLRSA
jgi:hypothetical protein